MQLDKDFRPVFHLLETQCDANDKTNANGDVKEAIRFNKINIGQMQILKNETNANPFDMKLQALQSLVDPADMMEGDLPVQNGIEPLPLLPACSPSFSSIVDEVFEYERGSTAAQNHSLSVDIQGMNARVVSPMHDGSLSHTQANNTAKVHPSVSLNSYFPSNFRHLQGTNTFSSSPVMSMTKLSGSNSNHDLCLLSSPFDYDIAGVNKSLQLVPSSNNNSNQIPAQSSHSRNLGNAMPGHLVGSSTITGGIFAKIFFYILDSDVNLLVIIMVN